MDLPLRLDDAREFVKQYQRRRDRWPDEAEDAALLVMLLNFGDHLTHVACINGEWRGVKGDLTPRDGVPLCPNGHVMTEGFKRRRLGFVDEPPPTGVF